CHAWEPSGQPSRSHTGLWPIPDISTSGAVCFFSAAILPAILSFWKLNDALGSSPLARPKPQRYLGAAHQDRSGKHRVDHAIDGFRIRPVHVEMSIASVRGKIVAFIFSHSRIGKCIPDLILQR